jgi:hypothetical protein
MYCNLLTQLKSIPNYQFSTQTPTIARKIPKGGYKTVLIIKIVLLPKLLTHEKNIAPVNRNACKPYHDGSASSQRMVKKI